MYLNELDDLERELFVEAAVLVIRSDDEVAEQEDALLDAISRELGAPVGADDETREAVEIIAELSTGLKDGRSKRIALLELAGIVVVDAEASPEELSLLGQIADGLGLTDELDGFVAYAEQVRDVAEAGQRLLDPEGP